MVCMDSMYIFHKGKTHPMTLYSPGLVPLIHQVRDVVEGHDGQLGKVLHVRPQQRVLPYSQVLVVLGVEQVPDPLAVDLHVADLH